MPYELEREVARRAVLRACALCRAVQSSIDQSGSASKVDRSPVTIADFGSQALINLMLMEHFPTDAVVSEEDSGILRSPEGGEMLKKTLMEINRVEPEIKSDEALTAIDHGKVVGKEEEEGGIRRYWTIDPIDGTKGFLRGAQYSVCLALIEDGDVVLGVLGCPNLEAQPLSGGGKERGGQGGQGNGTLFTAIKGQGAFMRLMDGGQDLPIKVSGVTDPAQSSFVESFDPAHSSRKFSSQVAAILGITEQPIRVDSQVKYAAIARGDAAFYLRFPVTKDYREKIWDHAAGYLIVKEAGGTVTDAKGRDVDFSRGGAHIDLDGIVATNGLVHDRVLDAVQRVLEMVEGA